MPEYVLNRNHTHRSLHGHIIDFKKGQPTYVPPVCERDVVMFGAEPVSGEKIDVLDDLPENEVPLSSAEREQKLLQAFEVLEKRNARGDFTGQGRPHIKALLQLCGFECDARERDAAWTTYVETRTEREANA